jgi:hypothetical protein
LTWCVLTRLLHFAFDGGALGDASISALFEVVGHFGQVAQRVKNIALARDLGPGEGLAGTQSPSAIGQRVVWVQALRL